MPNTTSLSEIEQRIAAARGSRSEPVRLVAVSKTQSAQAMAALAGQGQRAFGENYVQEALTKQFALAELGLEWHLIGPLQSNKCPEVARHFDWLQSLDREKLVALLARHRPPMRAPLNVLVQVNIDDETSKAGVAPTAAAALCDAVAAAPQLGLRGLMAIPAPHADPQLRQRAFERMRALFDALRVAHPTMDTLSMGMSEDFELAIRCGATMVRIGSALFGARPTY
jgi:hypothetical protein